MEGSYGQILMMNLKYFGINLSGQQISSDKNKQMKKVCFLEIQTFRSESYLDRRRQSPDFVSLVSILESFQENSIQSEASGSDEAILFLKKKS